MNKQLLKLLVVGLCFTFVSGRMEAGLGWGKVEVKKDDKKEEVKEEVKEAPKVDVKVEEKKVEEAKKVETTNSTQAAPKEETKKVDDGKKEDPKPCSCPCKAFLCRNKWYLLGGAAAAGALLFAAWYFDALGLNSQDEEETEAA